MAGKHDKHWLIFLQEQEIHFTFEDLDSLKENSDFFFSQPQGGSTQGTWPKSTESFLKGWVLIPRSLLELLKYELPIKVQNTQGNKPL